GGDPWGYGGAFVQNRLDASLDFILRHVGRDFSGTFIELGAFKGDFTKRIAVRFPDAVVYASDISPLAVHMMGAVVKNLPNVRLSCEDIATFDLPTEVRKPVKLLLLECLYYLPEAERAPAIERLAQVSHGADFFLSCPITGDPYPTEPGLLHQFKGMNYQCVGMEVLNYRPQPDAIGRMLGAISAAAARRRTAHQVIYRFVCRQHQQAVRPAPVI